MKEQLEIGTNGNTGLVERLARHEEGAAEAFVERFKPLLSMLALRYGPTSDAEDAVQEILLELWRTASRFDPQRGSETTFVATVARRRLIDRLRHRNTRPAMEELPADSAMSPDPSPETQLMITSISSALEQLRPTHRKVVEMSLFQGYSHAEIAHTLGLPLGTVKTIARRSLQSLRTELDWSLPAVS